MQSRYILIKFLNMKESFDKILKGKVVPGFEVTKCTTKEKDNILQIAKKEQLENSRMGEVNWEKLNSYVIKV